MAAFVGALGDVGAHLDVSDISNSITLNDGASERCKSQVRNGGDDDGQQGALGDGGLRVGQVTTDVGASQDARGCREEDGEHREEIVLLALVRSVRREEVLLEQLV